MQTYQHYTKVNQSQKYNNHTHEHVEHEAKLSWVKQLSATCVTSMLLVEAPDNSKSFSALYCLSFI